MGPIVDESYASSEAIDATLITADEWLAHPKVMDAAVFTVTESGTADRRAVTVDSVEQTLHTLAVRALAAAHGGPIPLAIRWHHHPGKRHLAIRHPVYFLEGRPEKRVPDTTIAESMTTIRAVADDQSMTNLLCRDGVRSRRASKLDAIAEDLAPAGPLVY